MSTNPNIWLASYTETGSIWIHDGNPKRPHALLTSEDRHAEFVFNSGIFMKNDELAYRAAHDLFDLFIAQGGKDSDVGIVTGARDGATALAEFLTDQVRGYTAKPCIAVLPTKNSMLLSDAERQLVSEKSILLSEDTITTGRSVGRVADAMIDARGVVLPFVLALMNRSGLSDVGGRKIVALVDQYRPTWTAGNCPLCKLGSEAIRPKLPGNWERLTAKY